MAALKIGWTPVTLREVSMALQITLARVPEESIQRTAIAENWYKCRAWLQTVQELSSRSDAEQEQYLDQVPPFPLTGQELLALQASIDRIAQAHAAASPTHVGATAHHVRRSFNRLWSSASVTGVMLAICAAIVLLQFALSQDEGSHWYLYLTLGCIAVALAFWGLHFWHLGVHKAILNQAHPLP